MKLSAAAAVIFAAGSLIAAADPMAAQQAYPGRPMKKSLAANTNIIKKANIKFEN